MCSFCHLEPNAHQCLCFSAQSALYVPHVYLKCKPTKWRKRQRKRQENLSNNNFKMSQCSESWCRSQAVSFHDVQDYFLHTFGRVWSLCRSRPFQNSPESLSLFCSNGMCIEFQCKSRRPSPLSFPMSSNNQQLSFFCLKWVGAKVPLWIQQSELLKLWVQQNLCTFTWTATASWSLLSAATPSLKWLEVATSRVAVWRDVKTGEWCLLSTRLQLWLYRRPPLITVCHIFRKN